MIEKQSRLYEVLLRFDADGLKGAHVKDLDLLVDTETGEVLSQREGDARPVTADEVGDYLTPAVAQAIERIEAREAALAAERQAYEAEVAKREAEIVEQRERLASAAASVMASI